MEIPECLRTKCETLQIRRDSLGRFSYTTGTGRYKRKQVGEKNLQEHRFIWEQHFGKIPEGKIVHHINGNKLDNKIANLQCITFDEHNKIHAHPAWNKGITSKNPLWKKINNKQLKTRKENYSKICLETKKLRESGLKLQEIANIQGISRRQVSDRLNEVKNV